MFLWYLGIPGEVETARGICRGDGDWFIMCRLGNIDGGHGVLPAVIRNDSFLWFYGGSSSAVLVG